MRKNNSKIGCGFFIFLAIGLAGVFMYSVYSKRKAYDESLEKLYSKNKSSSTESNVNYETIDYKSKALSVVKKEKKVKDAIINNANVLYVSVIDDGSLRNGYADYICQVVKDNKYSVNKVVIVKYGSSSDEKDNAYGKTIGESKCNW